MFKNCIITSPLMDEQLFKYVKEIFLGIIQEQLFDITYLSDEEKFEALEFAFPRTFLQHDIKKAIQILYDLEDIAKSDIVREVLPPIHQFVMYHLINDYLIVRNELGKNEYDEEIENYVKDNYESEDREVILNWLEDMLDDFVDQYGDEYIWEEYWEYKFLWEISHPGDAIILPKASEQMIELMPNDIIYYWNEVKEKQDKLGIKSSTFRSTIIDFKFFVEGNAYSAFSVTENPLEEIGRTLLQTYLTPRGFREAQMGGGRSDLVYPEHDTIIETKIWRGEEKFKSGILELISYLKAQGYLEGYYVIFDNTKGENEVIKKCNGDEVFAIKHGDFLVNCIFIKIAPESPSKKGKGTKKKVD